MQLAALEAVLGAIPGRPWKEATLEASPGTITVEKARAWSAAGINRVSLGVQSFVRQEIAATGLLATCLQHEIDHLNGVLFIDHISKLKRDRVVKKFSKAAKRAAVG